MTPFRWPATPARRSPSLTAVTTVATPAEVTRRASTEAFTLPGELAPHVTRAEPSAPQESAP